MVLPRHRLQNVGAGLLAKLDVALQLLEQVLFEFADQSLALEKIAGGEDGQNAEAHVGDAEGKFVSGVLTEKDQRVHEHGETGGLDKYEDGREDGEVQFTPFELIQFLAVQSGHGFSTPIERARSCQPK